MTGRRPGVSLMLRRWWGYYVELLADPATRFPVLTLTVWVVGCWALVVWIVLTNRLPWK